MRSERRQPRAPEGRIRAYGRLPLSHEEMLLRKQANQLREFFGKVCNLNRSEIDDAIAAAGIDLGLKYDQLDLGKRIGLTVEQYRRFKNVIGQFPASFLPVGFTKREAKSIRDIFNRPARTAAEHERRVALAAYKADRAQMVADLDCRASAIFKMLATDKWKTTRQLSKLLRRSTSFSPLSGDSLRRAIERELKKPALAVRVETTKVSQGNAVSVSKFRLR